MFWRRSVAGRLLKSTLLVDYQLHSLVEQYNVEKDDERIHLFSRIIDVLAAADNAMEREDYVQKAAKLLSSRLAIREETAKKKRR